MKIYELAYQDTQYRYFFFATKHEAEAERKRILAESEPGEIHNADISELEFNMNRKGVADLLNWFVSATCLNEG